MKILLVDDTPAELKIISAYLKKMGHELISCTNGEEAVECYRNHTVDLVLLDIVMPVMDGYEAARRIRGYKDGWVPIIFLSGRDSPKDIAAGIEAGGDDYLVKPIDEVILGAKMRAMERIADMRERLIEVSIELEEANAELQKLADVDGLTGIANRRSLDAYLENETARCIRENQPISVIMIDLDHFKAYNDYYGHLAGDNCLKRIADILQNKVRRPSDMAGRYGGEEFCIILPNTDKEGARHVAEFVRLTVEELRIPHAGNGAEGVVTLSLGVVTHYPDPSFAISTLLNEADKALYHAKRSGRNRVEVFG
jgi:diguanylate cyclase (GGDEF)-like protein